MDGDKGAIQDSAQSQKEWEQPNYLRLPSRMTKAAAAFYEDLHRQFGFVMFVSLTPARVDHLAETVAEFLLDAAPKHPSRPEWERLLANRSAMQTQLRGFGPLFMEMLVCRATDNFLAYISDLLSEILAARPEILRSWASDPVRLGEILDYPTRSELLAALIERRIQNLSQHGVPELNRGLIEQLAFELFPDATQQDRIHQIVELRNLLVHKRGIADRRFRARAPDQAKRAGQRVKVSAPDGLAALGVFSRAVGDIDARACAKFGLKKSVARKSVLKSGRLRDNINRHKQAPPCESQGLKIAPD